MAWGPLNVADAVFVPPAYRDEDSHLSAAILHIAVAGFKRDGVIVGLTNECAVTHTSPPNREWTVAAGSVRKDGVRYDVTLDTVVNDAGGTNDRWDLIVYDTGALDVEIVKGTEAVLNPVIPDPEADQVALYAVFCPAALGAGDFPVAPAVAAAEHLMDLRVMHQEPGGMKNVLDFGAVADDSTDSAAAFQAAVDAAEAESVGADGKGAGIYIPAGLYRVSLQTLIPNIGWRQGGFTVLGDGAEVSFIGIHSDWGDQASSADYGPPSVLACIRAEDTGLNSQVHIEGLGIGRINTVGQPSPRLNAAASDNGYNGGTAGLSMVSGIFLRGCDTVHLHDIKVNSIPGRGIVLDGTQEDHISNVTLDSCGLSGDSGSVDAAIAVNTVVVKNRSYANDCFNGHKILFLTAPNAGVIRNITDVANGDEITFDGAVLTFANGDDFVVIACGTSSGGTATTIVDAGQLWTTNQWVSWHVTVLDGDGKYQTAVVTSNTADTLTLSRTVGRAPVANSFYVIYQPSFALGCSYANGFAPTNIYPENVFSNYSYGPSVMVYGNSTVRPQHVAFTNLLTHPPEAPNPWPFDAVYFENSLHCGVVSGKIGPCAKDAAQYDAQLHSSLICFAGSEFTPEGNFVGDDVSLHGGGDATESVPIKFVINGITTRQHRSFHVGACHIDDMLLLAAVEIEELNTNYYQRGVIERIRSTVDLTGKIVTGNGLPKTKSYFCQAFEGPNDSGYSSTAAFRAVLLDVAGEKLRMVGYAPFDLQQALVFKLRLLSETGNDIRFDLQFGRASPDGDDAAGDQIVVGNEDWTQATAADEVWDWDLTTQLLDAIVGPVAPGDALALWVETDDALPENDDVGILGWVLEYV